MTSTTRNLWRDLTSDLPAESASGPRAISSLATSFQGNLIVAMLIATGDEDNAASLNIHSKAATGDSWKLVAEFPLTGESLSEEKGVPYARIFSGLLNDETEGAEVLRIDVLGGGFTAAITSADAETFETRQAIDAAGPVLETASVAMHQKSVVALARRTGATEWSLWQPEGPRSAQWQELKNVPEAPSRAHGPGAVAFAADRLWVAFRNPIRGFEIWSTPWVPENLTWTKSLGDGAWKWAANSDVFALLPFEGACYAATGANEAQQTKLAPFHRRAFELLRLYPEGDWDLLVGTPVFTAGGLRAPLSAKGPGLDQILNDRVFSFLSHQGSLFLLGRDLESLKLWVSQDGESWDAVPVSDLPPLGNKCEPELASTPFGLVIKWQESATTESGSLRLFLKEP